MGSIYSFIQEYPISLRKKIINSILIIEKGNASSLLDKANFVNCNMSKLDFLKNNQHLFWYLNKNELPNISDAVLVEFILNYGNMQSVKDLFNVLGETTVAKVFSKAIQAKRNNYFPQVKNYFDLYFKKNVPQYPF